MATLQAGTGSSRASRDHAPGTPLPRPRAPAARSLVLVLRDLQDAGSGRGGSCCLLGCCCRSIADQRRLAFSGVGRRVSGLWSVSLSVLLLLLRRLALLLITAGNVLLFVVVLLFVLRFLTAPVRRASASKTLLCSNSSDSSSRLPEHRLEGLAWLLLRFSPDELRLTEGLRLLE